MYSSRISKRRPKLLWEHFSRCPSCFKYSKSSGIWPCDVTFNPDRSSFYDIHTQVTPKTFFQVLVTLCSTFILHSFEDRVIPVSWVESRIHFLWRYSDSAHTVQSPITRSRWLGLRWQWVTGLWQLFGEGGATPPSPSPSPSLLSYEHSQGGGICYCVTAVTAPLPALLHLLLFHQLSFPNHYLSPKTAFPWNPTFLNNRRRNPQVVTSKTNITLHELSFLFGLNTPKVRTKT